MTKLGYLPPDFKAKPQKKPKETARNPKIDLN